MGERVLPAVVFIKTIQTVCVDFFTVEALAN